MGTQKNAKMLLSMKRILLTRSVADNKILIDKLKPSGYECIECSLIDHINIPINITLIDKYSHIMVTSKRAALIAPIANGNKTAWVVGASSAEILSKKNYNIAYIAESATDLLNQIPHNIYSDTIYLSGNVISVKMPAKIKSLEVYRVKYKTKLSATEIKMIQKGVDYIVLYSENCAKTLVKLILQNNLLKYVENASIVVISYKVGKIVNGYCKKVIISNSPNDITNELPLITF